MWKKPFFSNYDASSCYWVYLVEQHCVMLTNKFECCVEFCEFPFASNALELALKNTSCAQSATLHQKKNTNTTAHTCTHTHTHKHMRVPIPVLFMSAFAFITIAYDCTFGGTARLRASLIRVSMSCTRLLLQCPR